MKNLVTKEVKIDQIDSSDRTFAWRYREPGKQEIADLAESIRTGALLHPLLLVRRGKKYRIVCGFRRFAALTLLAEEDEKREEISCRVAEGMSEDDLVRLAYEENTKRKNVSPIEQALTVDRLCRGRKMRYEDVGELLSISPKKIQRLRKVLTSVDEVKDALHEGRIEFMHALLLAGLEPEKQREFLARVEKEGMPFSSLRKLIAEQTDAERRNRDRGWLDRVRQDLPAWTTVRFPAKGECQLRVSLGTPKSRADVLVKLKELASKIEAMEDATLAPIHRTDGRKVGHG